MIYLEKPANFNPKFEVVGNFIQCNGEIILLLRQTHKRQANTWGIPGGKVDQGEDILIAAGRETYEETGIIVPEEAVKFFKTIYVQYDDYDFIYHMFHMEFKTKPEIKISEEEHQKAEWKTPIDAFGLPLIEDLDACIKLFFNL